MLSMLMSYPGPVERKEEVRCIFTCQTRPGSVQVWLVKGGRVHFKWAELRARCDLRRREGGKIHTRLLYRAWLLESEVVACESERG